MMYLYFALVCIVSGFLYRMGGSDKFNTKVRDFGVPTMVLLAMWILGLWHWSLLICWPLMFGAMTTYWKILNRLFGGSSGTVYWYGWLMHGFIIGLAMLPYAIMTHCMLIMFIRAITLGFFTMVWSDNIDDVRWEEGGRGVLVPLTLLLYLICR